VAKKMKLKTIDLHTPMSGFPMYFPDQIHPNEDGANRIAEEIYRVISIQNQKN
jgi:lysophospholipase L1-like esterase